jgi:putative membrane-bound dehydrogenase-like protein
MAELTAAFYGFLTSIAPLLAPCARAQAPSPSAQDAAKTDRSRDITRDFVIEDGLAVTLWAETPQLFNPTAMDVDARGRVWITEAVNYRQWQGRNAGLHRPEGDRVVILEDTDGDGVCDSAKVFVQDKDLVAPLGIAVIGDKVIVSCSPAAYVYTDFDGDDKPDRREVLLTGFGGHDHDHGLHSFVAGPDGRWWFNTGNAGPHIVKDKSGWTLRSGSIYRGGGEHDTDNAPRMVSDDGHIWTGGLVLRVDPDGAHLRVLAHNFRNNYEVALDSFGNMWQSDNDDDGNASCRTLFVMEGGNHGYFSADGSRYWNADRRPGQSTPVAHWHQDDPGVVPAGAINGAGGPTGVVVYEGDLFGAKLDGAVLDADAGRNCVYAHIPHKNGAGFDLETTVFLSSITGKGDTQKERWFRPSDVAVGTDGSIFVADWWDPGVGGHLAGDREAYGRILRIAPRGAKLAKPKYDVVSDDGALHALDSPAVNVRWLGWKSLHDELTRAVPALEKAASTGDKRFRARALWLLARADDNGAKAAAAYLHDPDEDIRTTAFRALVSRPSDVLATARATAADPSPAVRREVALALADLPYAGCRDIWNALAKSFDGKDRWYLEALGIGARDKEDMLWRELVADAPADPLQWSEAMAAITWRLHPTAAVPALAARAGAASLSTAARKQAVDALAFVHDRSAAEEMATLALAGPKDVRPLALWWIENRDTNDWSAYKVAASISALDRKDAKLVYTSGIVEKGSVAVDADITGATSLWLVVTSGKRGNACDWSDWLEPRLVGPAGETKLVEVPWTRASAEWGNTQIGKNADGGKLAIGGREFVDGIGTHAASEIAYALPARGYARFREAASTTAAKRSARRASRRVQVYVDAPRDVSAWAEKLHRRRRIAGARESRCARGRGPRRRPCAHPSRGAEEARCARRIDCVRGDLQELRSRDPRAGERVLPASDRERRGDAVREGARRALRRSQARRQGVLRDAGRVLELPRVPRARRGYRPGSHEHPREVRQARDPRRDPEPQRRDRVRVRHVARRDDGRNARVGLHRRRRRHGGDQGHERQAQRARSLRDRIAHEAEALDDARQHRARSRARRSRRRRRDAARGLRRQAQARCAREAVRRNRSRRLDELLERSEREDRRRVVGLGRDPALPGEPDRVLAHRGRLRGLPAHGRVALPARIEARQLGRAAAHDRARQGVAEEHRGAARIAQRGRHLEHRRRRHGRRSHAHERPAHGEGVPVQREAARRMEPLRDHDERRRAHARSERPRAEPRALVRRCGGQDLPAIRGRADRVPQHRAATDRAARALTPERAAQDFRPAASAHDERARQCGRTLTRIVSMR